MMRKILVLVILISSIALVYLINANNDNGKEVQIDLITDNTISAQNDTYIIINEQNNGAGGTFCINMTLDDTVSKLKELGLDYNKVESTTGPEYWNNGHIAVITEDISFMFDNNNSLYTITIFGNIPTMLGLEIGDQLSDMEELYGKDYNEYTTINDKVYEYLIGDLYFCVFIYDIPGSNIRSWRISKFKFDKR